MAWVEATCCWSTDLMITQLFQCKCTLDKSFLIHSYPPPFFAPVFDKLKVLLDVGGCLDKIRVSRQNWVIIVGYTDAAEMYRKVSSKWYKGLDQECSLDERRPILVFEKLVAATTPKQRLVNRKVWVGFPGFWTSQEEDGFLWAFGMSMTWIFPKEESGLYYGLLRKVSYYSEGNQVMSKGFLMEIYYYNKIVLYVGRCFFRISVRR